MTSEKKGLNPNYRPRKPYHKDTADNTFKLRENRPTKTKRKTLKVLNG